jgi:small subunit ribosomal protein S4
VNGTVVNIPSYAVKPGDVVAVRESSRNLEMIHESLRHLGRSREMTWLDLDKSKLSGRMIAEPSREDIQIPLEEHLIVELYSK